jgi:hypothetical protein
VYLLLRDWPKLDRLEVPGVRTLPVEARVLGGPAVAVSLSKGILQLDRLPTTPPDANAQVIHLRFDQSPRLSTRQPAPRTTTVLPVAAGQPTLLPVTAARLDGLAIKGWRHCVRKVQPPDAALEQPAKDLPIEADQPYDQGPQPERVLHAILDWRRLEHSTTWTLETPAMLRVKIRVLIRCAEACAGSPFEIRCGDATLTSRVPGVASANPRVMPDWWKGFFWLPFVWHDCGEVDMPAGRSELAMQPIEIPYGCFFADIAALEIVPA